MMVVIHTKNNHIKDREYIYDVVFSYFWGLEYEIVYEERDNLALEVEGNYFFIDDSFFQMDESIWLKEESLPKQPLQKIELPDDIKDAAVEKILPVIYGRQGIKDIFSEDGKTCFLDIFGSAFFMLTRYEEAVKDDKDEYDRFPAKASLAYQEGFLERPIINEYLEILWQWLKRSIPQIPRSSRTFNVMATHDIDNPFYSLCLNGLQKLKTLAGDLIKRHDICLFKRKFISFVDEKHDVFDNDLLNTFELIMDLSDEYGIKSNFYFMTAMHRSKIDGNYDIFYNPVVKIIKNIIARGHYIGIHPGYGSYNNINLVREDTDKLRQMLEAESLQIEKFGGRQHYLSWRAPITWKAYEEANIEYDATLSYADHIGFRCGICYEYPVYNVITQERYKLKEYPLEIMDCTLWNDDYMHLSIHDMLPRCTVLKEHCRKYDGTFVVLWHNSSFVEKWHVELYKKILDF